MEGVRRAAKRTQSREEWWREPGGQPNTLRAGSSGGGGQELSQMHSESGGVVEGYITMTSSQCVNLNQFISFSIGDDSLREKERERERG